MNSKKKKTNKEEPKKPESKIQELTEALKRERADNLNLRRHHQEQLASLKNHVKTDLVEQLLPVIDNFERALSHTPKELKDHDYARGVNAIVKQFEKTLESIGVKKIKTVGEPFDPHYHEAISTTDTSGKEIITEEIQAGYKLDDQVIRHAKVKVG